MFYVSHQGPNCRFMGSKLIFYLRNSWRDTKNHQPKLKVFLFKVKYHYFLKIILYSEEWIDKNIWL